MINKPIKLFLLFSFLIFSYNSNAFAAPGCQISTSTGVYFNSYNVFQITENDFGIGSIDIDCGKEKKKYTVNLSTGQSNSFTNRYMNNGTEILQYNLFTTSARNVIWGDGSGGSQNVSGDDKSPSQLNIFGSIYPLQDVNIGYYSDFITVSINF